MKIYFKTWRLLLLPIAMLILGVVGVRTCMDPKNLWVGMILVFFAIMGMYFGVHPFIYLRPVIVIDERGIEDKRMKIGIIPWSDISRVMIHKIMDKPDLCIVLKSSEAYMHKGISIAGNVQRFQQAVSEPGLYITFRGFDRTLEETLRFITSNRDLNEAAPRKSE